MRVWCWNLIIMVVPLSSDASTTIPDGLPPTESSTSREPPYCFPNIIESLNWLHRNGFLETENDFLHCCADIYDQQAVNPRIMQLFGHTNQGSD
mmetsp:Transcript_24013/g.58706  ORF Transcript_24013/g.58706 Transcript_24013/m.58706 type:complete len:94 (+) Transcript_24013:297-578(+)